MSLDIMLSQRVYDAGITHNLTDMAKAAGVYDIIWRPHELGLDTAEDLIFGLESSLELLKEQPDDFRRLNPPNGWGSYEQFVSFVEKYLTACKENPDAYISVCR